MLAVLSACGNKEQSESKNMNTLTFNEQQAACISDTTHQETQEDNSRSEYDQVDLKSYWRRGNPNDAYAQYFTGRSYVSPYGESVVNVTFEPGCRNNWHVHHGAVQVLICVYGHGWYQEWGKPAVELKEGVVIEVSEGVKHWHGAAKNSWMQHLTYHKNLQPNPTNEWLEAVDDETYNKLK